MRRDADDDRHVEAEREDRGPARRLRRAAEEGDVRRSEIESRLVGEEGDRPAGAQRARDAAHGLGVGDDGHAETPSRAREIGIEERVRHAARDRVEGVALRGDEGAGELPVAEVRGEEDDPLPLRLRALDVVPADHFVEEREHLVGSEAREERRLDRRPCRGSRTIRARCARPRASGESREGGGDLPLDDARGGCGRGSSRGVRGPRRRPTATRQGRIAKAASIARSAPYSSRCASVGPFTSDGDGPFAIAELERVQPRVRAAAREQLGVRAALDDRGRGRARGSRWRAGWWRGGARSRTPCGRRAGGRSPPAPVARTRCRARSSPRRG